MKKLTYINTLLLTLSLLLTATITQAKIIKCINEKGKITFTDSSCPQSQNKPSFKLDQDLKNGLLNDQDKRSPAIRVYCHQRTEQFKRC